MLRYVPFFLAVLLFALSAFAQNDNALNGEARDNAENVFRSSWVFSGGDWWIYFEIPPNPFTPVLGQEGVVQGFFQARQVQTDPHSRPLTQADRWNGLEWSGEVRFVAEGTREYYFSKGWGQWKSRAPVASYKLEKRNGTWQVASENVLGPAYMKFRQPKVNELPGPNEGPRQGQSGRQQPTERYPCLDFCRDRYCQALRQKLIDVNACWQDSATTKLYNRISDAGYYFCEQKRQNRTANPRAVLQQWEQTWRKPENDMERSLDEFAVETAQRILCP